MTNEPADLEAMLREIEKRIAKATPEPWYTQGFEPSRFVMHSPCVSLLQMNGPCIMYKNGDADSQFIAHARTDLPTLCQIIRQLQGRVRELLNALIVCEDEMSGMCHCADLNGVRCKYCGAQIKARELIDAARQSDSLRGEGKAL